MKRLAALLLALLTLLSLTVSVYAADGAKNGDGEYLAAGPETAEVIPGSDAEPGSDDLFYQYMLQHARERLTPTRATLFRSPKTAGETLTGLDRKAYDAVVAWLNTIVAEDSTITSSVLTLDIVNDLGVSAGPYSKSDLGVSAIVENESFTGAAKDAIYAKIKFDFSKLFDALLADFPYQLFWMDKAAGSSVTWPAITGNSNQLSFSSTTITLSFCVAKEFSESDRTETCVLSREKVDAAITAAENAATVVATYADLSDYEKLDAYRAWICDKVAYNDAAMSDTSMPYGNPWQLIWAFDNDPNTKVVCEGYSKAFKYLCDLSTFSGDIRCYLVTGYMSDGTGDGGNHMWNIVTMDDDRNYLVDITNCDGAVPHGYLFLKGVTSGLSSGSTLNGKYADFKADIPPSYSLFYWYAADLLWDSSLLALSSTAYEEVTSFTTVSGGNYSYLLSGTTLRIRPGEGAMLAVAQYDASNKMTDVQFIADTTSTVTITVTGKVLKIISVGSNCVPLCPVVQKSF